MAKPVAAKKPKPKAKMTVAQRTSTVKAAGGLTTVSAVTKLVKSRYKLKTNAEAKAKAKKLGSITLASGKVQSLKDGKPYIGARGGLSSH